MSSIEGSDFDIYELPTESNANFSMRQSLFSKKTIKRKRKRCQLCKIDNGFEIIYYALLVVVVIGLSVGIVLTVSSNDESDSGDDENSNGTNSLTAVPASAQFWCGPNFESAALCMMPCPDGDDSYCAEGESCYGGISTCIDLEGLLPTEEN